MAKIVNPEIQALDSVLALLEPLKFSAQMRILDYVGKLLRGNMPMPVSQEELCRHPGFGQASRPEALSQGGAGPMGAGMPSPQASVTFERLPPNEMIPGPKFRSDGMPGGPGVSVEPLDGPE